MGSVESFLFSHFLWFSGILAVICRKFGDLLQLLQVCPSWMRDHSSVALPEVSPFFSLLKGFSQEFFLCQCEGLRTEDVVMMLCKAL